MTAAAAITGGLAIWLVDPARSGDAGLVTAMGPLYFVAVGLLVTAFVLALRADHAPGWLLSAQLALLIVGIHGLPALVDAHPRFFSAYLHAGFTDYIFRHGAVDPLLDARMSWPGFFSAAAMIQRVAGLDSALWFVRWFPVLITAAYLAPASLLCRSMGASRRARWIALWGVVSLNWVGQDYFSPQAFALLLYLCLVAVALTVFPGVGVERRLPAPLRRFARDGDAGPTSALDPSSRVVVWCVLVLLVGAIAVSHQLTPFLLPGVLGALTVTGRLRVKSLAIIAAIMAIAWLSYGASEFWKGHLDLIFSGVGDVGGNVSAGLSKRAAAVSFPRQMMLDVRIAMAATLLIVATIGFLRRLRRGAAHVAMLLLTFLPYLMVVAQPYGGETLLRSTFFALVPGACLGAFAIAPRRTDEPSPAAARTKSTRRRLGAFAYFLIAVVAGAGLVVACVTARFGNERFERVTTGEWDAMHWVYGHASAGDSIVTVSRNLSWRYEGLEIFHYLPAADEIYADRLALLTHAVPASGSGFLVITKSQAEFGTAIYGLRPGWLESLERAVNGTGHFDLVFSEGDAHVYRFDMGVATTIGGR
ncbi:MAG TPA: hypothetical protein VGP92_16955 [Acidimicrobiia bacterium]|nr:hypothetical protein [Acidimicrobiia bacterium]